MHDSYPFPLLSFSLIKKATSLPHLLLCVSTACLISLISLVGFYDTVSFFHTRWESVAGVVLCRFEREGVRKEERGLWG